VLNVLTVSVKAGTLAMTDPLSVAAGIAGLISFGIQVTESLVKFYTSYKGQDTDVARTTENLEGLLDTLKFLQAAVETRTFRRDEQDQIKNIESSIRKCDDLIRELQEECEKLDKALISGIKGTIKAAGRRAVYPFRQSTLQKLDEDISEIRDNLLLALDVLQLRDHKNTQDDITELKSLIEVVRATQISSTIRDWLKAPDATLNHNAACAKRHPGTGTWLVKSPIFTTWLTQDNSFLWLNGFAGCGKSVLCSTAIQYTFRHKRSDRGVGIAFFYFTFNDESKKDESAMIRALLLQLSGQSSDSQTDLARLRDSYSTGFPPAIVLTAYLRQMIQKFGQVYILLDALDESPRYSQRDQVLNAIETMRKWLLPGLHLLVTSRDEPDIRESLSPAGNEEVIMKNAEINRDISEFISGRLNVDPKLRKWRAHHDRIQKVLAERAQGVYVIGNCILIRRWLTKDTDFVGLNANSSLLNDVRGVRATLSTV
jgi:archaellum component FlaC